MASCGVRPTRRGARAKSARRRSAIREGSEHREGETATRARPRRTRWSARNSNTRRRGWRRRRRSRANTSRGWRRNPVDRFGALAIRRGGGRLRFRRQGPVGGGGGTRGGGGDPGEPWETRQQEGDCDVRQGGGGVQGAPGEASHRAQRPFQDRVGDSRARREEEGGASRHVDQGERGLRVHLLHPPALHQRQARTPRGRVFPRGARGEGGVRRGVERIPHRTLRRAAIAPRALSHPRAASLQARAHLHPRRGGRRAGSLARRTSGA